MSIRFESRQVLFQNAKILSTGVGQEIALMSVARGRYYALNPVASNIWERLAQPVRVDALAGALIRDYAGDPQQIEGDMQELLQRFVDEGLVDVATGL